MGGNKKHTVLVTVYGINNEISAGTQCVSIHSHMQLQSHCEVMDAFLL